MHRRIIVLGVLGVVSAALLVGTQLASARTDARGAEAAQTCGLGKNGNIQHVIYLQFDNTHFKRDNPNVPSDLEQMPNLLNFIAAQRHAAHERPHRPDLAHGDRHPHVADGRLSRPDGPARVQQLPLLHDYRRQQDRRLVRLLDGAALRSGRPVPA